MNILLMYKYHKFSYYGPTLKFRLIEVRDIVDPSMHGALKVSTRDKMPPPPKNWLHKI